MMKPKRFIDFYSNGDLLYCLDINKFGEVSAFHMYNVDSRELPQAEALGLQLSGASCFFLC